jgi:hypothetical protein
MFWTWNSPILISPSVDSQFNWMGHPFEKPKGYGTTLADFPIPHEEAQLLPDFWALVVGLVVAIKIVMKVMKRSKLSCRRLIFYCLRRELNHYLAAEPTKKNHKLNCKQLGHEERWGHKDIIKDSIFSVVNCYKERNQWQLNKVEIKCWGFGAVGKPSKFNKCWYNIEERGSFMASPTIIIIVSWAWSMNQQKLTLALISCFPPKFFSNACSSNSNCLAISNSGCLQTASCCFLTRTNTFLKKKISWIFFRVGGFLKK